MSSSNNLEKLGSVLDNFIDAAGMNNILRRCFQEGERASLLEMSGRLIPGDHLYITYGILTHHGIYSGGGQVIHYKKGRNKGVIEIPIQEFAEDVPTRGLISKKIYIKKHECQKFSREQSIERARSRIGEASWNLLFNNCEHFVEWCINGKFAPEKVCGKAKKPLEHSDQMSLQDKFSLIINDENLRKKLLSQGKTNIDAKTLGGKAFWDDLCESSGWRLQQNKLTGHCRIIDPRNVRRAWGAEKELIKAINGLCES
jgi:hypothetical protein